MSDTTNLIRLIICILCNDEGINYASINALEALCTNHTDPRIKKFWKQLLLKAIDSSEGRWFIPEEYEFETLMIAGLNAQDIL